VVKAMILLMESNVSGQRYVLNSENLSMYDFFSKAADVLGKHQPFIPVNINVMLTLSALEKVRSFITGSKTLMSAESVRSACRKSYYSSEKFSNAFNFSFIPIHECLKTAFKIIENSNN
jgi:dihydroflavonol-4-reductase